jgi:hypothetical protein
MTGRANFTFVEGPADPFDLGAWRAHRDRVRRLLEEDPTDEGYKASLRRAEFTVADIERVERLIAEEDKHSREKGLR